MSYEEITTAGDLSEKRVRGRDKHSRKRLEQDNENFEILITAYIHEYIETQSQPHLAVGSRGLPTNEVDLDGG